MTGRQKGSDTMSEHHEQHGPAGHDDATEGHIVSPLVYVVIFCALLVFTALTIFASYIEMGPWNPIVAIAIAVTKATLVVLFFMHVKYSPKLTKLTVGAGVFTFLILISMTLADYISRAWGRW
jgi:cytochrome c oxidase subunit 4